MNLASPVSTEGGCSVRVCDEVVGQSGLVGDVQDCILPLWWR